VDERVVRIKVAFDASGEGNCHFVLTFLFGRTNVDRSCKFMKALSISYEKSRFKKSKILDGIEEEKAVLILLSVKGLFLIFYIQ